MLRPCLPLEPCLHPPSQENLNIHLQRTNRILQLKLLQHIRMQDPKHTHHTLPPINPDMNPRRMALKERLILRVLLDPVLHALLLQPLLLRPKRRLQHQHDAVEQAVDDLKAGRLAVPGGGEVALVSAFALQVGSFERDIADFEDLDGQAVGFVLADCLEQAREEGGADDLIFGRFGVGEADSGGAVVFAVEPAEVFVVGAEDQGEDFGPAGHGGFEADDVGEFVDGERLGDGAGFAGEGAGELVEAVGDCYVFHYVGLVEDICSCWRDVDVDQVGI
jgi:hypothetical protein